MFSLHSQRNSKTIPCVSKRFKCVAMDVRSALGHVRQRRCEDRREEADGRRGARQESKRNARKRNQTKPNPTRPDPTQYWPVLLRRKYRSSWCVSVKTEKKKRKRKRQKERKSSSVSLGYVGYLQEEKKMGKLERKRVLLVFFFFFFWVLSF